MAAVVLRDSTFTYEHVTLLFCPQSLNIYMWIHKSIIRIPCCFIFPYGPLFGHFDIWTCWTFKTRPGVVVHAYNPSYLGGRDRRILV
jgi:hypothetical protein